MHRDAHLLRACRGAVVPWCRGAALQPSWAILGHFGVILGHLGANFGDYRTDLGDVWLDLSSTWTSDQNKFDFIVIYDVLG